MRRSLRIEQAAVLVILISVVTGASSRRPWSWRSNPHVETFHITAHRNTPVSLWPEEPESPETVDPERFTAALETLCAQRNDRIRSFAQWILADCEQFSVDPFLLAALMYDQSGCRAVPFVRYRNRGLLGPTHFPLEMHASHVRRKHYIYYVRDADQWIRKELSLPFGLTRSTASDSRSNLALSAAVLHVMAAQRETLLKTFPTQPRSRHFVSHWFFGEWVKNPEPENRVLTARRRLLEFYRGKVPEEIGRFRDRVLMSPLDGTPRLVLDYFGNRRGRTGSYTHRGIDIDGAIGEPVRAVADGWVTFTGVDKPGSLNSRRLTVAQMKAFPADRISQGGGFYVSIRHERGVTSMYMHLDSFCVEYRQKVEAGEVIGTLGQSGARQSGPHLHLELLDGEQRIDPAAVFRGVLVNPFDPRE